MTWTTDTPKEPGWYWLCEADVPPTIIQAVPLKAFGGKLCCEAAVGWSICEQLTNEGARWSEKLEPPTEAFPTAMKLPGASLQDCQ